MKLLMFSLLTVSLAAQAPRPWMQGQVEYFCHQTKADIDRMRKQFPDKANQIQLCACKHVCDPSDPNANETGGRKWDAACKARCNPDNCNCRHQCEDS